MAASDSAFGGRRVAIVDGLRTPFAKAGTDLKNVSAYELGARVVTELVNRARVPVDEIDRVVFGSVVQDVAAPNIAREIVLAGPFPESVDAFSVTRACATSTQSVASSRPTTTATR